MAIIFELLIFTFAADDVGWGVDNPCFSPDAAVKRLSQYLSKTDFETLFPYRYGSDSWKRQAKINNPAPPAGVTNIDGELEYYSYENFQEAMKFLADIKYKIEWRCEDDNTCSGWNSRISVYRKSTKQTSIVQISGGWAADYNANKRLYSRVIDLGSFLAEGTENDRKREIAALLANFAHETGGQMAVNPSGVYTGNDVDKLWWGLYYKEEVGYNSQSSGYYVDDKNVDYPPVAGKSYHGRGPMQLSWNYNYGRESVIFYQDKNTLLNNPEKVTEDGKVGLMTGLAFWMTPDSGKPSCHDVMTGRWQPNAFDTQAGRTNAGFGMTVMIINGGVEGGFGREDDHRVKDRIIQYERIAEYNGAQIAGEQLDTKGMSGVGDSWGTVYGDGSSSSEEGSGTESCDPSPGPGNDSNDSDDDGDGIGGGKGYGTGSGRVLFIVCLFLSFFGFLVV